MGLCCATVQCFFQQFSRSMAFSFYWHDYETFGADPQRDRPAQFAGIRTDYDFNIIGDPLTLYCKPANDFLPQPEACLITGITPQLALERGVPEAEFIGTILQELAQPNTCSLGYNSLRFDDEVTRNTLYRNLFDPYAREWKNGNSRWDLIDVMRLARALRPDGIEWPFYEDGKPSMRLEHLTDKNGIEHGDAHDALADVRATIALARLLREKQPKLYDFLFKNRGKQAAKKLLDLNAKEPVIHVSAMFPSVEHNFAIVLPLVPHPTNPNGVLVYNLRADPSPLLSCSAEEIHQRMFTTKEALEAQGLERIPVKTVHLNKSPVLAPLKTLDAASAERLGIDLDQQLAHAEAIKAEIYSVAERLTAAHQLGEFEPQTDPDLMIYHSFFSDFDRQLMDEIHTFAPEQLTGKEFPFQDTRSPEMLFRYRARNWPETLGAEEREKWENFRMQRILEEDGGGSIHLDAYQEQLIELRAFYEDDLEKRQILRQLEAYPQLLLS